MNSLFQITKFQAHVCSPKRMAELTDRCFSYAMLERGPVQVGCPASLLPSKCASILLLVQHSQKDQSFKCHLSMLVLFTLDKGCFGFPVSVVETK